MMRTASSRVSGSTEVPTVQVSGEKLTIKSYAEIVTFDFFPSWVLFRYRSFHRHIDFLVWFVCRPVVLGEFRNVKLENLSNSRLLLKYSPLLHKHAVYASNASWDV